MQLGEKLGLHTELFNKGHDQEERPNTNTMFAEGHARPRAWSHWLAKQLYVQL